MNARIRFSWNLSFAACGAALLALAGCAGPAESQLYGERYHPATIDTYPVIILKVDGSSSLERPVRVAPGHRVVAVQAPPGGGQNVGRVRPIERAVTPCTRYWLVAVKDNRLAQDFSVKVDYEEPIAGCRAPS